MATSRRLSRHEEVAGCVRSTIETWSPEGQQGGGCGDVHLALGQFVVKEPGGGVSPCRKPAAGFGPDAVLLTPLPRGR